MATSRSNAKYFVFYSGANYLSRESGIDDQEAVSLEITSPGPTVSIPDDDPDIPADPETGMKEPYDTSAPAEDQENENIAEKGRKQVGWSVKCTN
jgi:hypothetical protein